MELYEPDCSDIEGVGSDSADKGGDDDDIDDDGGCDDATIDGDSNAHDAEQLDNGQNPEGMKTKTGSLSLIA